MLRILLLADTHLGFDLPARPRSERTRRGPDFFARFRQAVDPARRGEVDLVVHGGDLLFRSRVSPSLVMEAVRPLLEVADFGVPVVIVPGNHERSALPYPLSAAHENLHVLDRPRTLRLRLADLDVAVSGFPCMRKDIRSRAYGIIAATNWRAPADVRLLCLHQTVEGATVGPGGFVFRGGPDVLPARAIPRGFAAVLAGHIHKHQVLTRDLGGRPLPTPVVYPGSTERTSFAERAEKKGFVILEVDPVQGGGGRLASLAFHELPARPMEVADLQVEGLGPEALTLHLAEILRGLPGNAVVQIRCRGRLRSGSETALRAEAVRRLHGPDMLVSVMVESEPRAKALFNFASVERRRLRPGEPTEDFDRLAREFPDFAESDEPRDEAPVGGDLT